MKNIFEPTIQRIRELAEDLAERPDDVLRSLRDCIRADQEPTWVQAAAIVVEAIKRVHRIELFDTQIQAGLVMCQGGVAEMQTGEGKTLSAVLPTVVQAISGAGVHVAAPNQYLARRDHVLLSDVYAVLGLTCGYVHDQANDREACLGYRADVTFAASHTFGFDFLRDAWKRKIHVSRQPGSRLLNALRGQNSFTPRQRRPHAAIIDEVDDVLLDDAISPLILSGVDPYSSDSNLDDSATLNLAQEVAAHLQAGTEYQLSGNQACSLTPAGMDVIYRDFTPSTPMKRTWHEYVDAALRARHAFLRDVHYIIHEGKVQLIDGATGRLFQDRTWSRGLQQAVETYQGLAVTPEPTTLARTTKQSYFRRYPFLAGMTGTARGCERELVRNYQLIVHEIPTRLPSRRELLPMKCFITRTLKYDAVVDEAIKFASQGRAVLIGTLSIDQSRDVSARLAAVSQPHQVLNGVQDADEASVIAAAGRTGQITVATSMAGRGTDIALEPDVRDRGGLHVIVTQMHSLARVDRQLIGRGARCGDPGSARCFVSAEDPLLVDHGPWVCRAIERVFRRGQEIAGPAIVRAIERIQTEQQQRLATRRADALAVEISDQSSLSSSTASDRPTECWAI
ncbi:preprotein translocase subunit SecA [Neorhodopirellula pilleata]|uniref:Preprotein translocase subunit SecA n=1 Tax=Neorhodopirellula pilleata TaxID=2714738 RepID=A0A5C6AXQ1_9BACT|nr:preprotein translocase subunit SecA [Neorhodopirellula pilleata]TWU03832.1 preprotein translocase subunit SecA [Neorhodopirellula pilleata]